MKILISPGQTSDPGKLTAIPPRMQRHVASWSHAEYRKYDFGSILKQHFEHKHYRIYIYYFVVEKNAIAYASWDKPTVALQATLKGEIKGTLKGEVNVVLPADTLGLLYLPPGAHKIYLERGLMESIHIEFEPGHVEDLTEDWNGQQELMNMINIVSEKGLPFQRADMNYSIKEAIGKIKDTHKIGIQLKLEFRSRIADLLKLYLHEVEETTHVKQLQISVPNKEKLISIWRSIKTNPNIHLHHLEVVARKYYLHPKTISRNFPKLFGIKYSDFVQEQCMKKGRFLITTTRKNIDEIAEELGYLETKSFNRAFQRQYNITPQSLRSNQ